jgi:hypothetical protein
MSRRRTAKAKTTTVKELTDVLSSVGQWSEESGQTQDSQALLRMVAVLQLSLDQDLSTILSKISTLESRVHV